LCFGWFFCLTSKGCWLGFVYVEDMDTEIMWKNATYRDFDWPNGKKLAVSFVLNLEETAENSILNGDKYPEPVDELGLVLRSSVRNYANESNYWYGVNVGGIRLLELFNSYEIKTTVTACAVALKNAPSIVELINNGNHEVCSHGYYWRHQFRMTEDQERDYIKKAKNEIHKIVGYPPEGWLSRYLTTENTRQLLNEEGFLYTMDDYSHDRPFLDPVTKKLIVVPYALDTNDMKFWLSYKFGTSDWLEYCKDTLDWLLEEGNKSPRMMSVGLHCRISGRPGRMSNLRKLLDYVVARDDVWIATRRDIARVYLAALE